MDTTARVAPVIAALGLSRRRFIDAILIQSLLVGCNGLFIANAMARDDAKNNIENIPFPPGVRAPFTTAEWIDDRGGLLLASEAGLYEWRLPEGLGSVARTPFASPWKAEFNSQVERVFGLKRSADLELIAIAGGRPGVSGMLEVWRIRDKQLVHRWEVEGDVVYQVDWSQSSRWLVAAGANGICSVFDVKGTTGAVEYKGHSSSVITISVMRDERTVVSGAIDQTIHLWSLETGEGIRVLDNHTAPVRCLIQGLPANETEKSTILSASEDQTVRLWQPYLGRLVRFAKLPSSVSVMEAIPNRVDNTPIPQSPSIVVGCDDGTLHSIDIGTMKSQLMPAPNRGRVYRLLRYSLPMDANAENPLVVIAANGAFISN